MPAPGQAAATGEPAPVEAPGEPSVPGETVLTGAPGETVPTEAAGGPPPLPMYPPGLPYGPPPAAPRRRYGLLIGFGVGGVVLVLLLCVALVPLALKGSGTTRHAVAVAAGVSASPSPEATARQVSAADYASELASLDQNLVSMMSPFAAATTPDSVTSAADTLATEFAAVSAQLHTMAPSTGESANNDLASSLSNLASRATEIGESAGTHTVCAGSSALATLSTSVEADQVRSAAKELLAVDSTYAFGKFLPAPTQGANRRLGNGQQLKKASGGSGQLTAENKGDKDAVLTLATAGATSATAVFYVQAGQKATIRGIRDGSYLVYIRSGTDWDATLGEFTVDCKTDENSNAMAFKTTRSTYSVWTITFGITGGGGNDELQPVDPTTIPA
jgi:hypothetical protein